MPFMRPSAAAWNGGVGGFHSDGFIGVDNEVNNRNGRCRDAHGAAVQLALQFRE
jgi:hypothetical protein